MEVYGTGRNVMGTTEGGRKTATEVGIVQSYQTMRFDDKRKAMAMMLTQTFRKKNAIVQKFWTPEQVLPVLGYDGFVHWVKFRATDLKGQCMVRIDPESMSPITKRMKRAESFELLKVMFEFAKGGAQVNPMPILQELIRQSSWLDVMQLLPQAGGGQNGAPESMGAFVKGQQQTLAQQPARVGMMSAEGGVQA